jgi:hypothetical protein
VHLHIKNRDDRTIRVDIATFLKEILGGLGGVQYDDNLAKNTKREHIPVGLPQASIFEPGILLWNIQKVAD